jgi:multidrug resistance efflux pump
MILPVLLVYSRSVLAIYVCIFSSYFNRLGRLAKLATIYFRRCFMSTPFSRSMQSLAADGFRYSLSGMLLAAALLSAWTAWFFIARITLYEISAGARLEVSEAAHPVEAQVAGRVRATHLVLGQEVQGGDVLVELDVGAQRLQLEEERTRLAALASQPAELRSEISAEEAAKHEDQQARRIALDQARARYREAEATAQLRVQEAQRIEFLYAHAAAAELELLRAKAEVRKNWEAADVLRLDISRLERDLQMRVNDRQTRLQRLRLYVAQIEGQISVSRATRGRLEYEIERRYIRAPVAGSLGEVATLQVGTWVREGARLGAVVPPGTLKVMADFLPSAAIGRIQTGQPARLRLEAFPWTQYGAVSATVASVASEVRDGRVRVELTVRPNPASLIPFQHGLPGTVEVEVDRVSPAILVLRTAGQLLAVRRTSRELQDGRGADGVPGTSREFQDGRGADGMPGTSREFQDGRGADR